MSHFCHVFVTSYADSRIRGKAPLLAWNGQFFLEQLTILVRQVPGLPDLFLWPCLLYLVSVCREFKIV